jgi:P21-Rho-binding domain
VKLYFKIDCILYFFSLESRETNGKAPFQKPNISKLIKSFKSSLSHFLENLYKEQEEEEEREMVIGYPTDVRHVTHVGVENLKNTKQELPEFLSLGCVSSLSVGQYEKAMEAQAGAVVECSSLPRQHGQLGVVHV